MNCRWITTARGIMPPTRAVTPWDWSADYEDATGASVLRKGSCRKLQTESIWYGGPGRFMRKTGSMSCGVAFCRRSPAWCVCSRTPTTPIWASTAMRLRQFLDQRPRRRRRSGHHEPSLAHHPQVWFWRQRGTESRAVRHGVCALGMDNGKTESFAYTEIDSTFNEGVGVNGALWHRTQDRAGIAFVSNGIKKDHQVYLADAALDFCWATAG